MYAKFLAAAFAITAVGAANAAIRLSAPVPATVGDPFVSGSETILVDFNTQTLPTGYMLSGNFAYATGTNNDHATPAGDTSQYLYTSSAIPAGIATLTTPGLSSISFYWGSIDTYNFVDILGTDGMTLGSFSGSDIPPADGNQTAAASNRRAYFTGDAGEVIGGIRFRSTGVAFEIDNIAGRPSINGGGGDPNAAVPEPASWVMLIAGFGLVGAAARRRRTMSVVAA